MKTLRFLLCSLLFPLLLPASHANGEAPDSEAMRSDVEARLHEFYAFYCHALNVNQSLLDNQSKLKTVCERAVPQGTRPVEQSGGRDRGRPVRLRAGQRPGMGKEHQGHPMCRRLMTAAPPAPT